MEEGALVWRRDLEGEEAWILCEVLQRTSDQLTLQQKQTKEKVVVNELIDDGQQQKFKDVELANTPLSQEEKEEGLDNDLITLPHLHEPAILHSLSDRFFRGKIYTWTGPVLIAVNPFQRLPLYTTDILEQYRQDGLLKAQGMQTSGDELEPHIFAVSDRSYRQMMSEKRQSQSILISGESGAGKTESTKIVMLYLTTLGAKASEQHSSADMSVMQRVLQSNPVLEAFGNARTLRNDNSSRFGKFIELGFSRAGHLMGAKVQTYLLEKVRLAFHAAGERNYHIFYQLLRGCSDQDHARYEFHDGVTGGLDLPNFFHYTGQGGAPHLREFSDEQGLEYTLKAMQKLGWSQDTIDDVLKMVAGLLHLGQIRFQCVEVDGLETADVVDTKSLNYAAKLLGVEVDLLRAALTERIMLARGEEIKSLLTPEKAADARDALAKTVYGALFLWVVDQVNKSIGWENDSDIRSSCGVLDIFGFECFAVNSFEQLCINYTNEALQQQFNQFIFKLEQAEYEAEGIEWAFIEFPDNQDCLDTIQMAKTGILAILDDECRLPKGSDRNFAKRTYEQFLPQKNQSVSANTRFHASKIQQAKALFSIRHFAGLVEYNVDTNFMEKNKDEIPITAKNMFENAPTQLIKDAYAVQALENQGRAAAAKPGGRGGGKQKTVGQQFKEQLSSLIENIQKTDPHYIRCIKPNDAAKPMLMTRKRTTEQLRYGGVLEAVRVARAGYPVRLPHEAFYQRYRMLLPSLSDNYLPWSMEGHKPQDLCVRLVDSAIEDGAKHAEATENGPLNAHEAGLSRAEKIRRMQRQPIPLVFPRTDVQLGKTKVFMRKHPHDCLEAHRVFHQAAAATLIQCWARGLAEQRKLYIVLGAVEMIQRYYRGSKGRERWWRIKGAESAMLLTKVFRMLIKWRSYNRARKGTIKYQALARGYNVRREFATVKTQKYFRRYTARKRFTMLKSATIALQCRVREKAAKKVLAELLKEQKDVGKLKQNNEKLKEEMASLRAMLSAQAKEGAASKAHEEELAKKEAQIAALEKRIAEIEKELAAAKSRVEELESQSKAQQEAIARDKDQIKKLQTVRPQAIATRSKSGENVTTMPHGDIPANFIGAEKLNEHRAKVAILEEELEAERKFRREADGEIIRLRAKINGVELSEAELKDLLAKKVDIPGLKPEPMSEESSLADGDAARLRNGDFPPEVTGGEEAKEERSVEVQRALNKLGISEKKQEGPAKPSLVDTLRAGADTLRSGADFIPRIRRGFMADEEKAAEDVAVGWKVEVHNRREREEALRDDVHRFEIKMKKYLHLLEEGVDVVMWQLNRGQPDVSGGDVTNDFALKASNITMKMHRRGDLYVQAVLNFMLRGGYLGKAMGRNRNVDKTALEPLSLHDILEVHAGCSGFDHAELPSASSKSSKSKSKKSAAKAENKQSSLFLTIQATPTPVAASRSYIFRFKSRSARNDVLNGLRTVLADMQINEGVSISGLHSSQETDTEALDEVMVPLSAVHEVINRERESYDRILLMLLQGGEDLKEKEDELLKLRNKLESATNESKEKDRVQANDSKLIMQLSKKLENLLMENEELRDQNDRLNNRLVTVESEKMNYSGRGQ